ncbi:unnamed protein product [Brassica rapa]|uniref:Uncharacterized protein n=1 Tax=Brassica campestris TaxID=3711 RepID=A0A3P6C5F8_BRACM|nr:unnamed protein product [Brassica rapa]VDD03722.1 unnamed protein product [Brassica rapa]
MLLNLIISPTSQSLMILGRFTELLENNLPLDSVYKSKDVLLLLFVSFSDKNWLLVGFH